ncbi:unnamed protein product [Rhizophagus irregularis]|uniref:Uncharacterized protein n=1 Tax=Rhizophagus irregularis TaxID=588596 RepID=A0A2N1M2W4_9GLOM|nr:hypothetical protein RhiirC2_801055 [Rhizophagus irregularis]CAB5298235.1 unnamed protein product [Rhizophagus irregularis]
MGSVNNSGKSCISFTGIPPDDAPNWSYVDQPDMVYDTEYTGDDDNLNINDEDLDAILANKGDKSESFMQED